MRPFRTLRRAPGFSATVILTLALGIGPGTAMFSAIDRLLLRSLPYPEPDRLVALHETQAGKGTRPISLPNLLDWRAQSTSFESVGGFMTRSFGLSYQGGPVAVVMTGMVTSDLFRALASGPHLGRTFSEAEESQGAHLIVLTDELWAREFQRTPPVIGQTVQINETPYQVIGVLPPDFVFPAPASHVDAYIPLSHQDYGARDVRPLEAVARLKPGVSLPSAQAELHAMGARLALAYPAENSGAGATLEPLDDDWKGSLRRPLLLLSIAALLLLALVCGNVVNLILVRSLARAREMDIRRALGAQFADIARQLLTESALLCAAGGLLAWLLASAVLRALPLVLRRPVAQLSLDSRALAFTAAVCLLTTLFCGLAPIRPWGKLQLALRGMLVAGQVALSLMLLLSAGLFLRVFLKLVDRNPGFQSSHVFYFGFGLPDGSYTDRQMVDFHTRLHARLREIPGVESTAVAWRLPLNGRGNSTTFQFEGAGLPTRQWTTAALNIVDPDYTAALRIPLLAGRTLSWQTDILGHPPAVLVNRAFEAAFPHSLGKRIQVRFSTDVAPRSQLWQIAGIVGDTYQVGLDHAVRPQIYLPITQTGLDGGDYLIRTARTDANLAAAVSDAVRSIDPHLEQIHLRKLDDWVGNSLGDRRFPAILTGIFAAIGLALTMLGLYGTLALEVAHRRREMAIRIAVGATEGSIVRLVVSRGLLLTLAGTALGAAGYLYAARALAAQLYEVAPSDPANALTVIAILFACAALASLAPACRAARQHPISILREVG